MAAMDFRSRRSPVRPNHDRLNIEVEQGGGELCGDKDLRAVMGSQRHEAYGGELVKQPCLQRKYAKCSSAFRLLKTLNEEHVLQLSQPHEEGWVGPRYLPDDVYFVPGR